MILRKKDHLVGLDIGSARIKAAELKQTSKGYVLKKFGVAELAPGAIVEGNIVNVDEVAQTIRALFKKEKIKEKNVAISTGGYSVVVKTINVPTVSEKDLQESIRFEAEQYIPYDIEDVNIDFQILGPSEFSPDQMNVLLVAVKKDLVAEYIDLINIAGLNPCIIDVDTFALQNVFEKLCRRETETGGVCMLVDVGASKTSLNILKGTASLMMRDNASGAGQICDEIVAACGCSPMEADRVLSGTVSGLISDEELTEICSRVIQNWTSEVFSVVNSYQAKASEGSIEKIILSGGGAFISEFADTLAEGLSIDISTINPFKGLIIDPNLFPDSYLAANAPLSPIALGLALRKVDDK